jgi:hypothetical protein
MATTHMNKFIRILCILMIASLPVLAQDEALGSEGGPDPGAVPVDGGITLLLAAGAAYGASKLRRRRDAPGTPHGEH